MEKAVYFTRAAIPGRGYCKYEIFCLNRGVPLEARDRLLYDHMPQCPVLWMGMNGILYRGYGVSFQAYNHLPGGCGTAPKCNNIIVAAPQRKVRSMMDLPCACSRSLEYWRWGR
ncbi:MAG: hypothetical protein AMK69_26545 [Nitrospira bacterium SG8_3]|nr:MAG: hypothetical protein AMK69_26545 [Nitrospira bacterium SG8_3]